MKSLTELNSVAGAAFEITDDRPAGVIFDRFVIQDRIITVSSTTINATPSIEIEEVINYSSANVRYIATIHSSSSTFLSGSNLNFGTLPSGVVSTTSTTSTTKTYTLTGINSDAIWQQIRQPVWTIPAGYATFTQWYLSFQIVYYDQATDSELTKDWLIYDPNYYYLAQLQSSTSQSTVYTRITDTLISLTPSFDLETDGPFKTFRGAFNSLFTVASDVFKFKGIIKNLSAQFSSSNDLRRIRTITKNLPATFSMSVIAGEKKAYASQMTVVAGYIGPGGKAYLEGNGFQYPTGLGFWPQGFPGITRIRSITSTMTSQVSLSCVGADARLVSAMVMSTGTLSVDVDHFIGTVQALTSSTQMVSDADANRDAISVLSSQTQVLADPIATFVSESSIVSTLSQSVQPLRIKQGSSSMSTQSAMTLIGLRIRLGTRAMTTSSSLSTIGQAFGPMILTYNITETTKDGGAERTVYLAMSGTVNASVDWGDGSSNSYTTAGIVSHTYASIGEKTITINRLSNDDPAVEIFGAIPNPDPGQPYTGIGYRSTSNLGLDFDDYIVPANRGWFTGVTKWGHLGTTAIPKMFHHGGAGAGYPTPTVTTINPNISDTITDISVAFIPNISAVSDLNVSNVRKGQYAFANNFNQPLNNWNVSGWTNMSFIFIQLQFNQPLNNWNTSSATSMKGMFRQSSFNQSIGNWNVSNVVDMSLMFNTTPFNQNINNWNVSNVTTMANMFTGSAMKQPLNDWDVSNVTSMASMFSNTQFNQPLNNWDTGNVSNMDLMFSGNTSFDQNISGWCVSLIPSKPTGFDTVTSAFWTTAEKPIWGTCP